MNQYYVYIMTNFCNQVLYIGLTNNMIRRVYEHKNKLIEGFTSKYNVDKLVYYEIFNDIEETIKREKQLKNWHHGWKVNLIKEMNPEFKDLYEEIIK